MADHEHLKILSRGVEVWNQWRKDNPNIKPDLRGVILSRVNLTKVDLSNTYLSEADLSNANFSMADLSEADFSGPDSQYNLMPNARVDFTSFSVPTTKVIWENRNGAKLSGANFSKANLSKAKFIGVSLRKVNFSEANLSKADLSDANLSGVDLRDTNLTGANLEGAYLSAAQLPKNLSGVNLSHAMDVIFDGHQLKNTIISPFTTSPWFTLRRRYTGSRTFIHFILLILFLMPYTLKMFFWYGVHKGQNVLVNRISQVEKNLGGSLDVIITYQKDPNSLVIVTGAKTNTKPLKLRLSSILQTSSEGFRKVPVWKVLLGIDKGWWYAITVIILIIYNTIRLILTNYVSVLSDEQNRTGYTPYMSSYASLFLIHIGLMFLFIFATCSFLYHFWCWMTAIVYLPNV
ncbi:MAG: pentapeptide repeat-containing protein [Sedimentisphaerales bacterium]|nr:pentapeptide repeat-containing protein [Sedimentisphaerales bacterium]